MLKLSARSLGVALLVAVLLLGCGQKGPLYLPKSAAHAAVTEQMTPRP